MKNLEKADWNIFERTTNELLCKCKAVVALQVEMPN